jgi:uncharacterized protein YqeY
MSLQQQIVDGWKDAMKSGQTQRRDVLSGLRAAVKNAEIEAKSGIGRLDDAGVQKVVEREAKKRRDAMEEYAKVGRDDRVQTEREELEILQEFLPAQLSDEELETLVRETIAEANASSPKEMGAVMKLLSPKIAGRADGRAASECVKRLLSAASQ